MITSRLPAGKPAGSTARSERELSVHDRLIQLEQRLAQHAAKSAERHPESVAASVALLVRPGGAELEILVIQRGIRAGDPWSGHMAFPGGRQDPADRDALATAIRETREEVGIDLARHGRLLGALDAVQPRAGAPAVAVSPFVFAVPPGATARPNYEVAAALWIPIPELTAPQAATEYVHALDAGDSLRFPAFGVRAHTIWGLTHRILLQFIELGGYAPAPGDA